MTSTRDSRENNEPGKGIPIVSINELIQVQEKDIAPAKEQEALEKALWAEINEFHSKQKKWPTGIKKRWRK